MDAGGCLKLWPSDFLTLEEKITVLTPAHIHADNYVEYLITVQSPNLTLSG
jgi:hypothetical protein